MKLARLLTLLCVILYSAPTAALTAQDLAAVGVHAPANASLSGDAALSDLASRKITLGAALGRGPGVVVFADYRCTQLCSPILGVTARALEATGLAPGADYHFVVIGFNPRETPADAKRMLDGEIGLDTPLGRSMTALLATPDVAARLTGEVGFHYVYDKENARYAHPAVVFVVDPRGKVSRVLSGLALEPAGLREAIVEAGEGRIGALADQLHVLCYGLSASVGVYDGSIRSLMMASGVLTLAGVAGGLGLLALRQRRPRR